MASQPSKDTANANLIQELQVRLKNLDQWKDKDQSPEAREELTQMLQEIKLKVMAFQFGHGIF